MQDGAARALQQGTLHEAFQLFNLETNTNSSLLEYGLNLGFIEKRPNGGRFTMELINTYPMSTSKLMGNLAFELLIRLGVFIPATNLIKMAIDLDDSTDREDTIKCLYVFSIFLHQITSYDETSIRTLNRMLMCVAIVLFSLFRLGHTQPCEDMKRFKQKIKRRLLIDYYLWCLMFAMNFVLTVGSPVVINPEYAAGILCHLFQNMLNTYVTLHLCYSMRSIGYGRLVPLIFGSPLLFMDAGDDISLTKTVILVANYVAFWLSDWSELVDWNHSMLCDAGICKILNTEPGSLKHKVEKAKRKFDEWRLEEGLDDDGWFILIDAPSTNLSTTASTSTETNGTTNRPARTNETSSPTSTSTGEHMSRRQREGNSDNNDNSTDPDSEVVPDQSSEDERDSDNVTNDEARTDPEAGLEEGEGDDDVLRGQQLVDYSDRVIYLQSRNPLLTTLAAIMLIIWK